MAGQGYQLFITPSAAPLGAALSWNYPVPTIVAGNHIQKPTRGLYLQRSSVANNAVNPGQNFYVNAVSGPPVDANWITIQSWNDDYLQNNPPPTSYFDTTVTARSAIYSYRLLLIVIFFEDPAIVYELDWNIVTMIQPFQLTVTVNPDNTATLMWDAPGQNQPYYLVDFTIKRSSDGGLTFPRTLAHLSNSVRRYHDLEPPPPQGFIYQLACQTSVVVPPPEGFVFIPYNTVCVGGAPSFCLLQGKTLIDPNSTPQAIRIYWVFAPSFPPNSWELWRSKNGGAYELVASLGGSVTTFTDTSVINKFSSDLWCYKVRPIVRQSNGSLLPGAYFDVACVSGNFSLTDAAPNNSTLMLAFGTVNIASLTSPNASLDVLVRANSLNIASNSSLTQLTLPKLQTLDFRLDMSHNTVLNAVDFPALVLVGDTLDITSTHDSLQTIGFPALVTLGDGITRGSLFCSYLTALTSLDLSRLQTAWRIQITNCPELTAINLAALTATGHELWLYFNPKVRSIAAPLLRSCQWLSVNYDEALQTVNFTSLQHLDVHFEGQDLGALASLDLLSLETVYRDFVLQGSGSPQMTTLNLSNLVSVGGNLTIRNMLYLNSLNLSSLETVGGAVGGNIDMANNFFLTTLSLPKLVVSDGTRLDFSAGVYNAATVNGILALCVASNVVSCTIDLSGGLNAAPTGQGLTDKQTLINRGNTVTTN